MICQTIQIWIPDKHRADPGSMKSSDGEYSQEDAELRKRFSGFQVQQLLLLSQSKEQHIQHLKPQESMLAKIYHKICNVLQENVVLCRAQVDTIMLWLVAIGYCHVVFKWN